MRTAAYIADLVLIVVCCICAGVAVTSGVLWIALGGVWPFAVFLGAVVSGGLAYAAR